MRRKRYQYDSNRDIWHVYFDADAYPLIVTLLSVSPLVRKGTQPDGCSWDYCIRMPPEEMSAVTFGTSVPPHLNSTIVLYRSPKPGKGHEHEPEWVERLEKLLRQRRKT